MSHSRLDDLAAPVKNLTSPPLQLWHPELSGDIDIVIKPNGQWYHEGGLIEREALMVMFASILRREEDGHYYLVTPVEKWRITVEALPLVVTDFDYREETLTVTLNTGRQVTVGGNNALYLTDTGIAAVTLAHGLAAQFSRASWYRLIDCASESAAGTGIRSGGEFYILG